VTIDGADARDFDDAVYCERKPKGWKLLVCIADVSSYVTPGSALDEEASSAATRCTSRTGSSRCCRRCCPTGCARINPGRPAVHGLRAVREPRGQGDRSRFFEGVMRSHARLTYDQVAAMLDDGDPALRAARGAAAASARALRLYQAAARGPRRARRHRLRHRRDQVRLQRRAAHRAHRAAPAQRRPPHHRGVHARGQRRRGAPVRAQEDAGAVPHPRDAEGREALDLREFLAELGLRCPAATSPPQGLRDAARLGARAARTST
jgi:ribonuclease R